MIYVLMMLVLVQFVTAVLILNELANLAAMVRNAERLIVDRSLRESDDEYDLNKW